MPASDIGTVKKSLRYIASGSAVFAPSSNATPGLVGVTTKSTFWKTDVELACDQRAGSLGAAVVGVVVAARQRVGPDQDAALDLVAEAVVARLRVHRDEVVGLDAQSVAHAVEAREVGGRLGRGEHVVGAEALRRRRERDLLDARAELARHASASPRRTRGRPARCPPPRPAPSARRDAGRRAARHSAARPAAGGRQRWSRSDRVPTMWRSSSAASVTSRVNGPAWSSDDAKAIIP